MANVRVEVNRAELRRLLKSTDVLHELERHARPVAAAAGPGNEVRSSIGRNRARAAVVTVTLEAMLAEARTRNLSRAVDAAR